MTRSELVGHVLVALPIAHVLGASLFLWSYCVGFGSNIIAHVTVSDLLSVSIRDMVLAYLASLIVPAMISLHRITSPLPYAIDRAQSIQGEAERALAIKNVVTTKRIITFSAIIFLLIGLALTSYQIWHGMRVSITALQLTLCPAIAVFVMTYAQRREWSPIMFEFSTVITIFTLTLFFTGLEKGQFDRVMKYSFAASNYTRCKDAALLRQISGDFIAALPGDRRAIVSPDCTVKFTIGPP
jgi:lysylphosphatidylglycerol synthetase-like protein (DUF2156 family)